MERLKEPMANHGKCNKRYDGNVKANKRDRDKAVTSISFRAPWKARFHLLRLLVDSPTCTYNGNYSSNLSYNCSGDATDQ